MAAQKYERTLLTVNPERSMRRYLSLMGKFKLTLAERLTLSALFVGMLLLLAQLVTPRMSASEAPSPELPGTSRVESLLGMDELA